MVVLLMILYYVVFGSVAISGVSVAVIRYAGPRLDIAQTGNDLALSVLKGVTESMDYAYAAEGELPNRLILTVRN